MKSNVFKMDIIPSRVLSKRYGARFVYYDREQNKWRYQRVKGLPYTPSSFLTTFAISKLMEAYCIETKYYNDGSMFTTCNYYKRIEPFVDYEEGIPFARTKKCAVAKITGVSNKEAYA